MSNVIIAVGPTGGFATKADSPYLPTTPEEIAAEATAAYAACAAVVSVHLRDEQQRPTADPDIARPTMDLIGEQSPILVQLSTGVSPDAPFEDRAEFLELRPRTAENLLQTVRALPGDSVWQAMPSGERTSISPPSRSPSAVMRGPASRTTCICGVASSHRVMRRS